MRILIIDDDIALCQSLAYQLRKNGFLVDICHDGTEGLELILKKIHDFILLDRLLPSISGTELLAQIRSMDISIPVILVTALGEIQERVEGLDSGADDYIVKPIDYNELMARIRSISRRPRQMDNALTLRCGELTLK